MDQKIDRWIQKRLTGSLTEATPGEFEAFVRGIEHRGIGGVQLVPEETNIERLLDMPYGELTATQQQIIDTIMGP